MKLKAFKPATPVDKLLVSTTEALRARFFADEELNGIGVNTEQGPHWIQSDYLNDVKKFSARKAPAIALADQYHIDDLVQCTFEEFSSNVHLGLFFLSESKNICILFDTQFDLPNAIEVRTRRLITFKKEAQVQPVYLELYTTTHELVFSNYLA